MRLGSQSPHLAQDAGLVTHGPPRVRETDRAVKRSHEGNSGCISDYEVQVARAGPSRRLGYVAMLIVHPDPESESVPEQDQMASGTAAHIEDPHPLLHDIVQEVELGAQEGLDLRRLRGRIQSPL